MRMLIKIQGTYWFKVQTLSAGLTCGVLRAKPPITTKAVYIQWRNLMSSKAFIEISILRSSGIKRPLTSVSGLFIPVYNITMILRREIGRAHV